MVIDRATVRDLGSRIVYREYEPESFAEINALFGKKVSLNIFYTPATMLMDPAKISEEKYN